MRKFTLAFLLSASVLFVFGQETNPVIDTLIKEIKTKYGIPSITASLVTLDTAYYGIGGTTKTNGNTEVKLSAKYHLGSNTKAVTSFLAFHLIEEGKIKLSSELVDLFPELKEEMNEAYLTITLADLLAHHGRVRPYTSGAEFKRLPEFEGSAVERRYSFAKYVLSEKPVKEKGTYSNAGYAVAGMMLGKAYGGTYEELLYSVMKDLSLDCFIGFPNKQDTLNPWGHWKKGKGLLAHAPDNEYKLENYALPAGDLAMNISDYSTFIRMHLRGLNGKNNYLKSKSYDKMHFAFEKYAYGWGNSKNGKNPISHHDGSAGTYYCHTVVLPKSKIAVVVMANSAEADHVTGIYELRNKIIQKKTFIVE